MYGRNGISTLLGLSGRYLGLFASRGSLVVSGIFSFRSVLSVTLAAETVVCCSPLALSFANAGADNLHRVSFLFVSTLTSGPQTRPARGARARSFRAVVVKTSGADGRKKKKKNSEVGGKHCSSPLQSAFPGILQRLVGQREHANLDCKHGGVWRRYA